MNMTEFHPGAAPYGNFINYYSFNPPLRRINFIPNNLLERVQTKQGKQKLAVFDVGCNSGDLTTSLYEHLIGGQCAKTKVANYQPVSDEPAKSHKNCQKQDSQQSYKCDSKIESVGETPASESHQEVNQIFILGCDIDGALIERAKKNNLYSNNIQFEVLDIMDSDKYNTFLSKFLEDHSSDMFDLTTCFSITMWIHLHHGDQGLLEFLQKVSQRTRYLIIEPQPWKCYKSAVRRVKKLGLEIQWQSLDNLKIKHDVVEQIEKYLITECGMKVIQYLGETEWERRLLLLENCNLLNS